jgi:thymidylate synthase
MSSFGELLRTSDKFAKKWGNLDKLFGVRENHRNMLQRLIARLQLDPYNKSLCVNVFDSKFSPSRHSFQCWVRPLQDWEKEIYSNPNKFKSLGLTQVPRMAMSLKWFQISMDIEKEYSETVIFYALLLHFLAQRLGMVADVLCFSGGDMYVLKNNVNHIKRNISLNSKRYAIEISPELSLNLTKLIELS